MQANWVKYNGNWAVQVSGMEVKPGDTITVTKKDGTSSQQVVDRVLATGIVTVKQTDKPRRRYECSECGDMVWSGSRCWETGLRH